MKLDDMHNVRNLVDEYSCDIKPLADQESEFIRRYTSSLRKEITN